MKKPKNKKTPNKNKKPREKKKFIEDKDVLHNVDRVFYELEVAELNRKLARLRAKVKDLEETNMQLEGKLGKMDEDRGDIICYLKRNLLERNTEVSDLQSKITYMTDMSNQDKKKHEKEMEDCKEEYNAMREQLITQNKLLTTQLNALDDFRFHRDELMAKFEQVQAEFDAQEAKFRKQIYKMERKAVVDRANLKREMEERMFNLATKFQQANQIRIAATSQRMVRENIAINNELNNLIVSTKDLDYENVMIRQQFKQVISEYQILDEENKKRIEDAAIQAGIIKDLTEANLKQKEVMEKYEATIQKGLEDKRLIEELYLNEGIYKNSMKILENRVNSYRYSEKDLRTRLAAEVNFSRFLEDRIDDVLLLAKYIRTEYPNIVKLLIIPKEGNILDNFIKSLTYTRSEADIVSTNTTVSSVSLKEDVERTEQMLVMDRRPPVKQITTATSQGVSFTDFVNQGERGSDHTIMTTVTGKESEYIFLTTSSEEVTSSNSTRSSATLLKKVEAEASQVPFEEGLFEEEEEEEEESSEEEEEEADDQDDDDEDEDEDSEESN